MSAWLSLLVLAYVQNIAFSLVSRARNRDSFTYHTIAAIALNVVWYCTFRVLVTENMDLMLLVPYTVGTVAGSLTGAKVSMLIEKAIGAKT
jgi:hypothetical protein